MGKKRYSEEEKQQLVSSYLASGQSCAAYARECGVSAVTLKSWQLRYGEVHESGFVALSAPGNGPGQGFRFRFGDVELEFEELPSVEWMSGLLKLMSP